MEKPALAYTTAGLAAALLLSAATLAVKAHPAAEAEGALIGFWHHSVALVDREAQALYHAWRDQQTDRAVIASRGAADTHWRIITIGDEPSDEVLRYAQNASGLLFMVPGSSDQDAQQLEDRIGAAETWLGVPWVTVESKQHPR